MKPAQGGGILINSPVLLRLGMPLRQSSSGEITKLLYMNDQNDYECWGLWSCLSQRHIKKACFSQGGCSDLLRKIRPFCSVKLALKIIWFFWKKLVQVYDAHREICLEAVLRYAGIKIECRLLQCRHMQIAVARRAGPSFGISVKNNVSLPSVG